MLWSVRGWLASVLGVILFIGTGWRWVLQASIPCLSMVATARKRSIWRVAGYFLLWEQLSRL